MERLNRLQCYRTILNHLHLLQLPLTDRTKVQRKLTCVCIHPSTRTADPTCSRPKGYFAYEIENNRLLSKLRSEEGELGGLLDTVCETGSVLFIPQDISLVSSYTNREYAVC